MNPTINLSIVIPAYMEASGISDTLQKLDVYLKTQQFGVVEVIVVVADSPDGTASIAALTGTKLPNFRVLNVGPRAGKGRDVRAGMLDARGRYRIFMDADLATPLHHLGSAYSQLTAGHQVVIATRNLLAIHKNGLRKFMSSFGNIFAQIMIVPGIQDTQCGFKGFSAPAAEAIFRRQSMLGWSFDVEILAIARLLGYKVSTIDVADWHDPKPHSSGLVGDSQLNAAITTFTDIIAIRLNMWRGKYRKPSKNNT